MITINRNRVLADLAAGASLVTQLVRLACEDHTTPAGLPVLQAVQIKDGDLMLLAGQQLQQDRGLWLAQAGTWVRPGPALTATRYRVERGTHAGAIYYLTDLGVARLVG